MGILHYKLRPATFIADLEDRYARARAIRGPHPRPMGNVDYLLLGIWDNDERTLFKKPLILATKRNPSGFDIFFDKTKEKKGIKEKVLHRFNTIPGEYDLRIESDYYQTVNLSKLPLPNPVEPVRVDLEPKYNYPFPSVSLTHNNAPTLLRGTVHERDGTGVKNVSVEISGSSNKYSTDESGQWCLILHDNFIGDMVTVKFTWPDGSADNVQSVPINLRKENSLGQAGLRGWVHGSAGTGIDTAVIQVDGFTGDVKTRNDGSWYFYFGLNQTDQQVDVRTILTNGDEQIQSNIQIKSRSVVQVPTFIF